MDRSHMDRVVRELGTSVEGDGRVWRLELLGRQLIIVTDSHADRMRIISPIIRSDQLSEEALRVVLTADFHTALDARYAISDGVLYSAFIHPLSSLTEEELRSGLRQTATLANNFGTSFSSGELVFGAPAQPAPPGRSL